MYFVDLPGYGFARRSKKESEEWAEYIGEWAIGRRALRRVFLLIDGRRGVTNYDRVAMSEMESMGIIFQLVVTKIDCISGPQVIRRVMMSSWRWFGKIIIVITVTGTFMPYFADGPKGRGACQFHFTSCCLLPGDSLYKCEVRPGYWRTKSCYPSNGAQLRCENVLLFVERLMCGSLFLGNISSKHPLLHVDEREWLFKMKLCRVALANRIGKTTTQHCHDYSCDLDE